MKRIYERIFGVPVDRVQAVLVTPRQIEAVYKQESELTSQQIHGVGADGSCWEFWREDADGQQWFKRISADTQSSPAQIHGIAPVDNDSNDDDFSDPLLEAASNPEDAVRNFLLRQAARKLKARHESFPMDCPSDEGFTDEN